MSAPSAFRRRVLVFELYRTTTWLGSVQAERESEDGASDRAIDAPGVRRQLRSTKWKALATFVVGMVLFVGFAIAADAVYDRADELERSGIRVDGVVVDYSAGTRLTSEWVDVEFAFDGDVRRERVQLDDSSPRYIAGEGVLVLVNGDNPDEVTIEGETNQSQWTVWLMVFAFVLGIVGVVAGPVLWFRTRRQRKLLSNEPWRRVTAQYVEMPSGNSIRGLLLVRELATDHVLTLVSSARWTFGRLGLRDASDFEIVGDPSSYVIVRAAGSPRIASARSPYRSKVARRWRGRFD